jgi:hypothetical protein
MSTPTGAVKEGSNCERSRRWLRGLAMLFSLAICLVSAPLALAMEGRVFRPDGEPAAGSRVSMPGLSGSMRTDQHSRFALGEAARVPFTLVVIGAGGEIYPPVTVTELPADGMLDIKLEPTVREFVTVTSGVAPTVEAPPASGSVLIGREELEERRPDHLAEALLGTPGIQLRGEGPGAVPLSPRTTWSMTLASPGSRSAPRSASTART